MERVWTPGARAAPRSIGPHPRRRSSRTDVQLSNTVPFASRRPIQRQASRGTPTGGSIRGVSDRQFQLCSRRRPGPRSPFNHMSPSRDFGDPPRHGRRAGFRTWRTADSPCCRSPPDASAVLWTWAEIVTRLAWLTAVSWRSRADVSDAPLPTVGDGLREIRTAPSRTSDAGASRWASPPIPPAGRSRQGRGRCWRTAGDPPPCRLWHRSDRPARRR